ncbi:MAG: pyrrolo-quinoline quinone, partial [Verrucomicrobia bacterium]|nr:pyrrolo-quinoline quinone [Verrucomicrobiota bacterium]
VFLSSTDLQNQSLLAMAVDRKSGKVLWQHKISDGLRRDNRSTFASPSPVTDGRRVIFFYSTGDLAAFDFAGQKLRARNIQTDYGTFAFLWTFSSSPLLYEGKL